MQGVAIYPGSFDPITLGHVDIIERGLKVFDHIIVAIAVNTSKVAAFSDVDRLHMIEESFAHDRRVSVVSFQGLLVDFARQQEAVAVLRGLRAASDFEYEFQMAAMNRRLNPDLETVFMTSRSTHTFISSTLIREVSAMRGDVSEFVPEVVLKYIAKRYA
ncbi:MAG: pantetheine-phosphate adenylyltransferase [Mariprofundaceae bacterium]|nr:pantetheine-phosphate adenylyltransferase [Mariprofundaceae bacterium]